MIEPNVCYGQLDNHVTISQTAAKNNARGKAGQPVVDDDPHFLNVPEKSL